MRPLRFVVAAMLTLSLLSYSATVACDKSESDAVAEQAVADDSGRTACAAGNDELSVREKLERAASLARTSIRAGVNLTRALARAGAHTATVIVRTVYHTATALT